MKFFLTIAGLLALSIVCWFWWWSTSPTAAFKRHFDSWPSSSISDIHREGYTGLASSSEYLIFRGKPEDIKSIINRRSFQQVEPVRALLKGSEFLDADTWKNEISRAEKKGISAAHLFETGPGGVYYVLITDATMSRAYYHYAK